MINVHFIDELHWSYESGEPTIQPVGSWQIKVDPFPCYNHDLEIVKTLADALQIAAPVPKQTDINVLAFEDTHRTNGWASYHTDYSADEKSWTGTIVLNGKRTEIHPAVTRYVTVHEYGHVVEYNLAELRYGKNDSGDVRREYAELRGCKTDRKYGGGTHHLMPGEIMANDFLHVMGFEREYWPHEVPPIYSGRSVQLPEVRKWWSKALRDLKRACG